MKYIRLFTIVLFLVSLLIPTESFACAVLEFAVRKQTEKRDVAKRHYDGLNAAHTINTIVFGTGGTPKAFYDTSEEENVEHGDLIGEARRNALRMERNKSILLDAYVAWYEAEAYLARAESDLDLCELAGDTVLECGHSVTSNHTRHRYSCGHYDYNCQKNLHIRRSCPTRNGKTCVGGDDGVPGIYRLCDTSDHVHEYPSDSVSNPDSGSNLGSGSDDSGSTSTSSDSAQTQCPRVGWGRLCLKGGYLTAEDDHRTTCGSVIYWDCDDGSTEYHQSRTCSRCGASFKLCSVSSDLCTNGELHAEWDTTTNPPSTPTPTTTPTPPSTITGGCGHTYTVSAASSHRLVSCSTNSNGRSCQYGSYYVCSPHTHAYPSGTGSDSSNSDSDDSATTSTTTPTTTTTPMPPTTTTPTVTTRPCGHLSTASGDHSLQASCSTDSNCIATSFYQCLHTSHTYAPTPAPVTVTPPRPTYCPANRWTNCGSTTSHATTCGLNHTYYTCNPDAVSSHSGHSSSCPASQWTGCGGGDHERTCGAGHTYYSCNPSAVTAHSGHAAPCPARGWTGCSGVGTEHERICGRNHTYYTCNPSAVTAHSWH